MSKTIENVAKALAGIYWDSNDMTIDEREEYISSWWHLFVAEAQAALEAAGVLVLPHEAEPQVGDELNNGVVVVSDPHPDHDIAIDLGEVSPYIAKRYGYKIISRKGYKAVIHEEKGNG